MILCSNFLDGFETKLNKPSRNDDNDGSLECSNGEQGHVLFPHVGKPLGKPSSYVIRGLAKVQAHR
uniref:Uncharacterized protein n=1 Tax=Arundo donax TaxID=35708 RepID=A0A0A9A9Y7_ARUDO